MVVDFITARFHIDVSFSPQIVNFIFIIYYTVEQILLLVCMGWRRFRYHTSHLLDLIIVFLLCVSMDFIVYSNVLMNIT